MNPAFLDDRPVEAAGARRATRRRESPPRTVRGAERSTFTRPGWWLWPHLLSLDAPLVSIVWQRWWARAAGVTLPWSREMILGLGVWLIYLADRLADSADSDHRQQGTARHIFSGERRNFLQPLALCIALILAALTPYWLPGPEFRAGLGLLALALGYFWLIHRRLGWGWAAYLPKEAVVGGMFGAGSAFFVLCRSSRISTTLSLSIVLFTMACFLNCALITKWERDPRDVCEHSSFLNSFPRFSAQLRVACVVLAVAALVVAGATASWFAVPVAASALLLAALDGCASRMSVDASRVLADMVLLTPWLGLAFTAHRW